MTPEERKGRPFLWSRLTMKSPVLGWRPGPYIGLLLVALVLGSLWYDYKSTMFPFTIVFNGRPHVRWTHQRTVEGALLETGLSLFAEDIVIPGLSSPLHANATVRIEKASLVLIEADGRSRSDERGEEREIGADDLSDGKDGVDNCYSGMVSVISRIGKL